MSDRTVAIVTGASRGIGKAIAKELASMGYDLVISHFDFSNTNKGEPDESFAQQTKKEIKALGVVCEILRADVSCAEDRGRLVDLAKSRFGRCDMLVNNAGIAPAKRADILEANIDSIRGQRIETNLSRIPSCLRFHIMVAHNSSYDFWF